MRATAVGRTLLLVMISPHLAAATLDDAKRLFEDRRLPQARSAFEAIARSGPSRAEATFYLGRIDFVADEKTRAAKHFERAVELDPRNARYHFWLGRAYGEIAQDANPIRAASLAKKVQHAFEAAVKLDPSYLDARVGLIDFYQIAPGFMGGGEEKAGAQVAEIERIDPAYAHLVRARLHRRAKKPELVGGELEAAVKRFPTDPRARIWLSGHHAGQEKWDPAMREATEAVRVDPSYMPGHYQVGRIASGSGKELAAGEAALRKYLGYVPKDDEPPVTMAHYHLAMIYEKLGRKDRAIAELNEVIRRAPTYEEAKKALKRIGG